MAEAVRRSLDDAAHILVLTMPLVDQPSREGEGLPRLEVRSRSGSLDLGIYIVICPYELRPQTIKQRTFRRVSLVSPPVEATEVQEYVFFVLGYGLRKELLGVAVRCPTWRYACGFDDRVGQKVGRKPVPSATLEEHARVDE